MAEYIERDAAIRALLNDSPEQVGYSREDAADCIRYMDAADVAPVRHGRWTLEAHDERVNYRWNVTAECSECCNEKKEIWAGFFAYIVPSIARSVALTSAKRVKLSNYCPNCGCKMNLEEAKNAKQT